MLDPFAGSNVTGAVAEQLNRQWIGIEISSYLHEKLQEYTVMKLADAINNILTDTLFVGLGNDSESGNNILYHFRQENLLAKGSNGMGLQKR